MALATAFKDRRAVVMTALGAVSGILVSFTYQLEPLWRELSVGLAFGVVIGGYLFHLGLAGPLRAAAFAVLSVGAWLAAERAAVSIFGRLGSSNDFLSWQGLVTGVAGGLIGAGLLALAAALLFPFFRDSKRGLAAVLVGGAVGSLLALFDVADTALVLFPPWQAAVAFCLARGLPASPSIAATR